VYQWVWVEDGDLEFMPLYADGIGGLKRKTQWGQRPAVIVRGNKPGLTYGIDTVYLLKFRNVVFAGGAVQYQQVGGFPPARPSTTPLHGVHCI
jgi:hypothetical protein